MKKQRVEFVVRGGKDIPLADNPCDYCGAKGTPFLAASDRGIWAFCSGEHRDEALRANGEPLTPAAMKRAGIRYIGPTPAA